jgi:CRISPR-associated protein (TIGR03986 family)
MNTFYNPYNFIPALPRDGAALAGLEDGTPAGHDRWHPQLWSGRIAVNMTAITPLLLVKASQNEKPHRELALATLVDEDGTQRVDLAPTQIKGMLRAAFEAVTNSRFGVVSKDHQKPLGYRSDASSGSGLLPVIVKQVDGKPRVTILGTLRPGTGPNPVPGAVLDSWAKNGEAARTATPALRRLHHRQHVEAWLAGETLTTAHGQQMLRWRVTEVVPVSEHLPDRPGDPGPWARVRGYLHLTGPTIKAKRWERLFITDLFDSSEGVTLDKPEELSAKDSTKLLDALRQLVEHQRGIHTGAGRDDIWHREHPTGALRMPWEFYGHEPGSTAWSRHLYDVTDRPRGAPTDSAPGWAGPDVPPTPPPHTVYTCWAEPKSNSRLRPVMVSRLLYDRSPFDLLHKSLHPAETLDELSPADRVFGWVAPRGAPRAARRAHRGQIRVVKVRAPSVKDKDAVTQHPTGKILPALSSPKPSQGRFYLSEDRNPLRSARAGFFRARQTLRGRKVYLYRRGEREGDTPSGTPFDNETSPQNSTVHGWVNAGAEFSFELIVDNLNDLELGALLWLFDPHRLGRDGQPGRHRLGMGKPYGFGVVELSLAPDQTTLARGDLIALRLATLDPAPANDPEWTELVKRFEDAVHGPLDPVMRAVRAAAAGVGQRSQVHYPHSSPGDDGYDWFVKQEKLAEEKARDKGKKKEPRISEDLVQPLPLLGGPGQGTLQGHR